jgi:hypothetical protein
LIKVLTPPRLYGKMSMTVTCPIARFVGARTLQSRRATPSLDSLVGRCHGAAVQEGANLAPVPEGRSKCHAQEKASLCSLRQASQERAVHAVRRGRDRTQIPLQVQLPKLQWYGVDSALPGCVRPPDGQTLPHLISPAAVYAAVERYAQAQEGQARNATSRTGSCALSRSAARQPTSDTARGTAREPARHTSYSTSGHATRQPAGDAPCGTAREPTRHATYPTASALGAAWAAEREA